MQCIAIRHDLVLFIFSSLHLKVKRNCGGYDVNEHEFYAFYCRLKSKRHGTTTIGGVLFPHGERPSRHFHHNIREHYAR